MSLGILFIDKVDIVGGDDFYVIFSGDAYKLGIDSFLYFVGVGVASRFVGLVTLQLDVVVVAECVLEPFDLSLGLFDFSGLYQSRYFAAKTGRAHNESLAVVVEGFLVGSRMRVEAFGPCLRHYLDEVVIACFVFREHDEVTARVLLVDMLMQ